MASRFADREGLLAVCPSRLDRPMYQQFLRWIRRDDEGQEVQGVQQVGPHGRTPLPPIQNGLLSPDIPTSTPATTPLSSLSPTPTSTPGLATITLPGSSPSPRLKSDATLTPASHLNLSRSQFPDIKIDPVGGKGKGEETETGAAADSEAIGEEAETPRAIEAIEQALDVFQKRQEYNRLAEAIETRQALKSALSGRLVIETIGVDGIVVRKVIDHIKGKYSVDEIIRMSESGRGEGIRVAIRDAYEVVKIRPRE